MPNPMMRSPRTRGVYAAGECPNRAGTWRRLGVLAVFLSIGRASLAAAQSPPAPAPEASPPRPAAAAQSPSALAPEASPPPVAKIEPEPPETTTSPVAIHAFASQGFILTTGNDYIAPKSTDGSFRFSEAGVNFTTEFADKLSIGIQAFAQNIAQGGNFTFKADWFYVGYRWRDWLGIRAGRLKIPFGIYNEVNDVDAARAPILLPQSVYPLQGREFLFAQTGAELYGYLRTQAAGALEYRLYAGSIFIDPALLIPPGSTVDLSLDVRYSVGGRLFWETPLDGLRIGASLLAVRLDVTAFVGGMVAGTITNHSVLGLGSAEYAFRKLLLTAEYSLWHAHQDSDIPGSAFTGTSERSYAMASYRLTPWLQPTAYYALTFPDIHNRSGGSAFRQDDVTLSLRFDLNAHWIIKAEGHYMSGTAALRAPLSVTPPPTNPADHWGVFLVKTTGYF
jgi:hypothetical protein